MYAYGNCFSLFITDCFIFFICGVHNTLGHLCENENYTARLSHVSGTFENFYRPIGTESIAEVACVSGQTI